MSEHWGRRSVFYALLMAAPILIYLSFSSSAIGDSTNRDSASTTSTAANIAAGISPMLQDDAYLYHVSADTEAKCLDGTPPAYYLHRGSHTGKHKWLVFFEGGGWCYDIEQCYLRSKTALGSSKSYHPRMTAEELRFYFSGSQAANPVMHNWNIVYVRYCDGSSYAGDAVYSYKGHPLYFKGKHNRDETIRSLFHIGDEHSTRKIIDKGGAEVEVKQRSYNMSSATEVVIAGCSAGGLGVFLGLDHMADMVRSLAAAHGNTNVTVRGLVDSGFFMDHTSDYVTRMTYQSYGKDEAVTAKTAQLNGNKTIMDYASCMRDNFMFMNISKGTNPACLRAHQWGSPVRGFPAETNCIFAANLLPHIKTPMFVLQPRFDQWQILHIFTQRYAAEGVNAFGQKLLSALQASLFHAQHPGHGAFVDSCTHHCTGCSDNSENPWSGDHIRSTIAVGGEVHVVSNRTVTSASMVVKVGNTSQAHQRLLAGTATVARNKTDWNEAEAFALWYERSLQAAPVVRAITPGVNWFFQERPYPCHDCCKCSVDMVGQLRKPHAVLKN